MLIGENSAWNLAMAIGRNCAQADEGNETEIGFDIHNDQGWLFVKNKNSRIKVVAKKNNS